MQHIQTNDVGGGGGGALGNPYDDVKGEAPS